MSKLEELRKKFAGGSAPTPENQNTKLKAEREKQKLASKYLLAYAPI